ncbi:MAG: magnesium transporter CorA family protein [Kiritimatiellae bacterium]|jgi:magnesium transporter|nr:magnesium transporter CorA family protein [Kiritimatiellia bacterium]MBR4612224.1 magnesium transporter CorA family protein [Kiritimatiellia bacterium]
MLTIYKWVPRTGLTDGGTELTPGCWVSLTEPTPAEIEKVGDAYDFPQEFLTDPLDKDERARVEIDEDSSASLIVIRVPCKSDSDDSVPYTTTPFGIIITPNAVITVCARQTALIDEFRQMRRLCPPYDRHRFAFNIMLRAATLFLRYLREIGDDADKIERNLHLHQALKNDSLIDLRDLQKALVYFTTSLTSDEIVVSRLGHMRQLGINEDDLDFLDDVAIEYRQALEMSSIQTNILTGTMDSFASVISNNLNVVMKSLTSVTIIFMLPTLISSIYGMNVHLPLQSLSPPESHSLLAFFAIMGVSVILALGAVFFFIKRKLF